MTQLESAAPVTELAMETKSQFYALEVMCRERAAVARKEMEYWLNEAEEWAQLRKANHQSLGAEQARLSDSTEPCLARERNEFNHINFAAPNTAWHVTVRNPEPTATLLKIITAN